MQRYEYSHEQGRKNIDEYPNRSSIVAMISPGSLEVGVVEPQAPGEVPGPLA